MAMTADPIVIRELRRKLAAYRVAFALLIGLAVALLVARRRLERPADEAPLQIVRLDEFIARAGTEMPDAADSVFWFLRSNEGTVHLHVLHPRQVCPLHIHRKSHEATLIVAGDAEVAHLFAGEPSQTLITDARPGMLVESPPFCAHSWKNDVVGGLQANLVFESPPFDGNLYLDESDRSMANGPPPTISDFKAELQSFAGSREGVRERPLSIPRLSLLLASRECSIAGNPSGPLAVYVVEGHGTIAAAARAVASVTSRELVFEKEEHEELHLRPEEAMALLVFRL
jgi:hypothetical protein